MCRQTLEGDVTIRIPGLGSIAERIIRQSLKDVYSNIPQVVERCAFWGPKVPTHASVLSLRLVRLTPESSAPPTVLSAVHTHASARGETHQKIHRAVWTQAYSRVVHVMQTEWHRMSLLRTTCGFTACEIRIALRSAAVWQPYQICRQATHRVGGWCSATRSCGSRTGGTCCSRAARRSPRIGSPSRCAQV